MFEHLQFKMCYCPIPSANQPFNFKATARDYKKWNQTGKNRDIKTEHTQKKYMLHNV